MKGYILEFSSTAIVWIFFVIVILIAIFHVVMMKVPWGPGSINYAVEFVEFTNAPSMVAESLSHYKIGDRQLLEHCAHMVVTGKSDSEIEEPLKEFLEKYNKDYSFRLVKDSETLMKIGMDGVPYSSGIPVLYKDNLGYAVVGIS